MNDHNKHSKEPYETEVDVLVEKHKIKISIERPMSMDNPPTEKEVVLDRLGMTRDVVFSEAVRYALTYGNNMNYVECDLPIDVMEEGIESALPGNNGEPYSGSLLEKTITVTADKIIEHVSSLNSQASIVNAHNTIKGAFGEKPDITVKSIRNIGDTSNLMIELEAERRITGKVLLPNDKPNKDSNV